MRKVYIVVGSTGEYSDHTTWSVAVYLDRGQAEIHLYRLLDKVKELKMDEEAAKSRHVDWHAHYQNCSEGTKTLNATLDPVLDDVGYAGVNYFIQETELFDHFDQFQETHNKHLTCEAK